MTINQISIFLENRPGQLAGICRALAQAKINIATEFMDTYLKSSRAELNRLDGKFVPVDKFYDPVVDACAAHVARLIKFFAGR